MILYIVSKNEKHLLEKYKKQNPLLNFDVLLDSELKAQMFGKVNNAAILYLKKYMNLSFSNAKKIIDNVPYFKKLNTPTIKFKDIYDKLLELNYIEKNPYFLRYLKNREIILSPLCDNEEIKYLLKDYSYKVESIKEIVTKRVVYEFETLKESYEAIYSIIEDEINDGIKLENIKIASSSQEFLDGLKTINKLYRFPFIFENKIKKNKLKSYRIFEELLKEKTLKEVLEKLNSEELIDEFISIYINLKDKFTDEEIIKYIRFYVESEKKVKSEGAIEFVDKYYIPSEDEVLIVPSFVASVYPCPISDDKFPGDKEFEMVHLLTTKQRNQIELIKFKELYFAPGKVIFLKHKFFNKHKFDPSIFEDKYIFEFKKIEQRMLNKRILDITLANHQDNKILYGKNNPYEKQLIKNVKEYRCYNHSYQYFEKAKKKGEITLSYTSMSDYLGCPYKYYLKKVLNLDSFSENEYTRKGNIIHQYFEDRNNNLTENNYEKYFETLTDPREKYLIRKGFASVIKAYEIFNDFYTKSSFKNSLTEKSMVIKIEEGVNLYGRADLLLIDNKNKYISVVDFKTSKKDFNKTLVDIGENLQLPIYLLLVKNYDFSNENLDKNYLPIGAHIYNCMSNAYLRKGSTEDFGLFGVTRIEEEYINAFANKDILKGLVFNDGKIKENNRVVNAKEIDHLIDVAHEYVISVARSIKEGDFKIHPRLIGSTSACTYCSYKDICYKEDSDNNVIIKPVINKNAEGN